MVLINNVSSTNGGFGLIEGIGCDFNGVTVVDSKSIHHIVNAKNVMEYSKDYSETVASTQFHYPDTSTHANSQKFTQIALNGIAQNITPTDNANYNHGFAQRKDL